MSREVFNIMSSINSKYFYVYSKTLVSKLWVCWTTLESFFIGTNMLKVSEINYKFKFSAIYCIVNKINHKKYIGQAQNLAARFQHYHRGEFNPKMRNSIAKHGIENFGVIILKRDVPFDELDKLEQYWMDTFDAIKIGYNIAPIAGSTRGVRHSVETKKKISEALKGKTTSSMLGKHHSVETKKKIRDAKAKNPDIWSKERKERHSKILKDVFKNRILSEKQMESVKKITTKKWTPEMRKKLSDSCKGRKYAEETKRKMSESAKKRWTVEAREKQSIAQKKRYRK